MRSSAMINVGHPLKLYFEKNLKSIDHIFLDEFNQSSKTTISQPPYYFKSKLIIQSVQTYNIQQNNIFLRSYIGS